MACDICTLYERAAAGAAAHTRNMYATPGRQ